MPRGVHRHLQQHGEPAALPLGLHLIGLNDHLSRHLHAYRFFFFLTIHLLSLHTSPVQVWAAEETSGGIQIVFFLTGFDPEKSLPEVWSGFFSLYCYVQWDEVSSIFWRSQAVSLDSLVCLVHCFSPNWDISASMCRSASIYIYAGTFFVDIQGLSRHWIIITLLLIPWHFLQRHLEADILVGWNVTYRMSSHKIWTFRSPSGWSIITFVIHQLFIQFPSLDLKLCCIKFPHCNLSFLLLYFLEVCD